MPEVRETHPRHKADIPRSNHRNFHNGTPEVLIEFKFTIGSWPARDGKNCCVSSLKAAPQILGGRWQGNHNFNVFIRIDGLFSSGR
jgi:hypothetical protein